MQLQRVTAALLLCALASGAATAENLQSAGCRATSLVEGDRLERSLEVDGLARTLIADVPDSIEPGYAVPLLLDFHGFGHSAAGVWKVSGFRELGEREKFITLYPQGLDVHLLGRDGPGWDILTVDNNREVAFARALIDWAEQQYCINRRRIFVTGFSNGAFLSHLLACRLGDRIAAAAPVGGGLLGVPCDPPRGVPVIIHHGRDDAVVGVDRARQLYQFWKKQDGCPGEREEDGCSRAVDCRDGTTVVYCEGDGAHRWPAEATARIWEFFRRHPRLLVSTPRPGGAGQGQGP